MSPIIVNINGLHECKRKSCLHHVKPNNCILGATWNNEKGECARYNNSFEDTLDYIFDIFECEYPALKEFTIKVNVEKKEKTIEYTKKGDKE